MNEILKQIDEAVSYLKSRIDTIPHTAIILGSGLGKLADALTTLSSASSTECLYLLCRAGSTTMKAIRCKK